MKKQFSIAGGSVPGTDHTMPGRPGWKNNQDAYVTYSDEDTTIGIIADGCGSVEAHASEVGAHIGVNLLLHAILVQYKRYLPISIGKSEPLFFKRVREDMLSHLRVLALGMGDSLSSIVRDYLSFTLIGFMVTKYKTYVFVIGDGYTSVNGNLTTWGPFANNAPPYPALVLTNSSISTNEDLEFKVLEYETDKVDHLLVASDGLRYVLSSDSERLPGQEKLVGSISQFWEEDIFFKNSDSIRGRLALMNRERAVIDSGYKHPRIAHGLLKDDTTLIVLRRNKNFTS